MIQQMQLIPKNLFFIDYVLEGCNFSNFSSNYFYFGKTQKEKNKQGVDPISGGRSIMSK